MIEIAPAKINLALHVRRRRPDGYHELETLFAFARNGDVLHVEPAATDSFAVTGPFAGALGQGPREANLATRAADAFAARFAPGAAHAITLDKHLPIASGIGGGSADAAATLRAMASLHDVAHDHPALIAIAADLGADVPACLLGRTTQGTGKGETLVPLEGLTGTPLLLVNPGVAVSTAAIFRAWDGVDRGPLPEGDLLARSIAGRNDLEPPAIALAPVIADVRDHLAAAEGVVLARMSGSGATCFALFERPEDRAIAAAQAGERGWWTLETELA